MIKKIIRYIEFLKSEYSLNITVHDFHGKFASFMGELSPYNIHPNPYCLYIKSSEENWNECIERQKCIIPFCDSGVFFGSCYSGVGEFIVPIKNRDELFGFISVSGYKGSKGKRDHFAEKYGFAHEHIKEMYNKYLSDDIPDIEFIQTVTEPLAAMLVLLVINEPESEVRYSSDDYIYSHIVSILHANIANKITVGDIADMCHYSPSFISRLFKERMGMTINNYLIKIRIEKAKRLLSETDISVYDIAFSCGFSDANYFIYSFGKNTGVSPKKYRLSHRS